MIFRVNYALLTEASFRSKENGIHLVRKSGVGDTSSEINRSLGDEYDSEEVFDLASDSLVLTSSDESYYLAPKMGGRLLHG